jgi:hypothetical protein
MTRFRGLQSVNIGRASHSSIVLWIAWGRLIERFELNRFFQPRVYDEHAVCGLVPDDAEDRTPS